ncbi:hypothetical protein FRB96_004778 [Tulasnella sp. 330]|nr:hypothetical protein FRB96_004778 [Tulasnella sp. 330]KAG8872407.1 hypothetical protein FRB97_007683 [Tulasnella sp. 331]
MEKFNFSHKAGPKRVANGEDVIASYQGLSDSWDRTIEEIRTREGFSFFLQATPFANLQMAATMGPIIIVNINQYRSDAIIVQATGELMPVPLPAATPSTVATLAQTLIDTTTNRPEEAESDRILGGLLEEVWGIIFEPC